MEFTPRPRVKICCISSREEAQLAIRYGASALGLVSAMPSGPGVIGGFDRNDSLAHAAFNRRLPAHKQTGYRFDHHPTAQDASKHVADRRSTGARELRRSALCAAGHFHVQVIHVNGEE